MLEINCQERRRRWAAPRAEISQEPRVITAQARAASPDRGHSCTGSNRARLGEGQYPGRLVRSSRRQGQRQDWSAGYDTK